VIKWLLGLFLVVAPPKQAASCSFAVARVFFRSYAILSGCYGVLGGC